MMEYWKRSHRMILKIVFYSSKAKIKKITEKEKLMIDLWEHRN
jgi:hypothetical protein